MTDRVGQQLGNYRLTRLLGRGGFAEVYLGEHLRLKTQAAIKVLHTSLEDDDEEGFLREAQTVARLKHPHIVRVFDFDVENHSPFLVMDYLPNGNIRRSYPKGTPLPLETIVSYVKQVASALQYAHDEKLIHRDIKPENMLLDKGDIVVLSDFGIALMAQSSRYQSTQEVAGTAAYMAPEQFQGHPRRASDQYALGIVVYEWLCGDRPFHGSFSEIASQHLLVPPPPLREKVPTISPDVERVVLTALEKDSHKRFVSVQSFGVALEQASQAALIRPVMLPPKVPLTKGPALPANTVAASSPDQSPLLTNVVTPQSQLPRPTTSPMPSLPVVSPHSSRRSVSPGGSQSSQRAISRRAIVGGLVGVAGLAVVSGGISLLVHSQRPQVTSSSISPTPTPHPTPIPTPTPIPLGTLLYTYHGHSAQVLAVAWSPDGKRIASGATQPDNTVQVWGATDGGHVFTYRGHSYIVERVAWSPDGRRIVSGSDDRTVQVWDATDGGHVFTYRGHSGGVSSVAWSPNGRRIASGSYSPDDKTVQVWDAADGGHVFTYRGHSAGVEAVTWSPDGRRIASGGIDQTVQVWDAADGGNAYTYRGHSSFQYGFVRAVAWSPDGKRIASAGDDNTVQVWDATDGGHVFTYRGHSTGVEAVTWSPDGRRIASGGWDMTVQVWDAADGGNAYTYRGHSDIVWSVVWSADGRRIASGSFDKTVQVWVAG